MSKENKISEKIVALAESNERLGLKINVENVMFEKLYELAAYNPILKGHLNCYKLMGLDREKMLISCVIDLVERNHQLQNLSIKAASELIKNATVECDHDWEDMGDYMQCTYPECQAIKRKELNEISFDELEDGKVYSFKHEGDFYIGKYERLSGNFFVGGDKSLQNHDLYFEASQCVIFLNDD